MEPMIVSRFAPSPTGRLHAGHAVSAITAHDFARARGGRFLLRIEDIDGTRSRPEHVAGILDDLAWLGLTRDGPVVYQSARLARYQQSLDRLRARGLLYPCFCTRADIAASGSAPHGPGGAVYPGTCRTLSPETRAARVGQPHAWRIDMAAAVAITGALEWHDDSEGTVRADPLAQGDVVLARKDAPASYHLAVTIDDAAQGVTDVVRGADLFAATDIHRLLQALLDLPTPRYHHHPLLLGADGERLAKRSGAPSLAAMRAEGIDGAAFATALRTGQPWVGFSSPKA
ncbi:tRNA glutamyl-Q(34) synthetase GluQRS [Sphingomonas qomolangmaensis]|uniref:tRNA glutamyl-Q(34) synthetase GluQRS n=1 Tax=Sphingomonas qomolangmaensis TaxID=2918765 RepID=A0ABY5L6X6_9SPHN|nr:tRNA glutamyl-Q(34) synthetase GluQRS [Sphingomonas qomolangmaensis]UUL81574.1 tRNA glutamyl-Q(34) synthetase GluQRS [Sphingomonas qomolangmaensis]